jgi:hypothetical protein
VKIQRQENPRPSQWRAGTNSAKTENNVKQGLDALRSNDVQTTQNELHNDTMQKRSFIELKQNLYTTEVTTLPPSFLIKIKNVFLPHFYSKNAK